MSSAIPSVQLQPYKITVEFSDTGATDAGSTSDAGQTSPHDSKIETLLQQIEEILSSMQLSQSAPAQNAAPALPSTPTDDTDASTSGDQGQRLLQMIEQILQQLFQPDASEDPSESSPAPSCGGDQGGGGGVGSGGDSGLGAAPAPQDAGTGAPAGPTSQDPAAGPSSGDAGAGALSTAPQTQALSADESKEVAGEYSKNLQRDFGLSPEQAAGVVGNLWHESGGMNSGINQGGQIGAPSGNMNDDNGNGYGLAQWGGERKQGLIQFAADHGLDPSSQAANYGFLKQELSGPYKDSIDAVKNTSSVDDATVAFCNAFEKPSDPQMASRLEYAHNLA